jgi:hypothetical protein
MICWFGRPLDVGLAKYEEVQPRRGAYRGTWARRARAAASG